MNVLADTVYDKNVLLHIPKGYLQKRSVVEFMFIVAVSPLLLLSMLLVSLGLFLFDDGPVFFIQQRPGRAGKLFRIYKFRTMYPDCDDTLLTGSTDKRVTPLGTFLRRSKMDELPQFINVLKGEMSIIGPRPVPERFYNLYKSQIPDYSLRHLIRPGITGWAQVRLGYTETLEQEKQKFQLDLEYIKNIGFAYDIAIIRDTILSLFSLKNKQQ